MLCKTGPVAYTSSRRLMLGRGARDGVEGGQKGSCVTILGPILVLRLSPEVCFHF